MSISALSHRAARGLRALGMAMAMVVAGAPSIAGSGPAPLASAPSPVQAALSAAQADLMRDPAAAVQAARATREAASRLPPGAARVTAIAKASWIVGAGLAGLNQPTEALAEIDAGLNGGILRTAPRSKLAGDLYLARGVALIFSNRIEPALPAIQRAYDIYAALGERRSEALALQNLGSVYLAARDFDRALRYYNEAADTFSGDPALSLSLLNSRATVLMEQGRFADAAGSFDQARAAAATMKSDVLVVRFLASMARAQLAAGQVRNAEASLRRAFALSEDTDVGDWMQALYWTSAEIARRRGQLDVAKAMIDRTFAGVDLDRASLSMRDYLRTAYAIFKARGQQREALRYLEAYKKVDDQSRAVAASAAAALMSARFDYQGQQTRIVQLRANEKAQAAAAEAKLRSTMLNAVLIAASLIVGLLTFAYFSIRRSRNEVRAANSELSGANVQLEHALAARTEFLAMTSHEIRTPLNGILGMTQVLLADRAIEQGVRGKIELVHGAGETMKALVDDLLDVAKMTNGEMVIHREPMDLARVLRELGLVWAGQAQTRGIALAVDSGALPDRIVEDEPRLRQILSNLVSNAIKFTDRGEVRLTGSIEETHAGERLRIAVADTGIGIPAEALETIFESFRQVDSGKTRRHGGTGLGLSICRSLARTMGGDVTVESVVGAGSTFLLDLPLERAAAPAATASEVAGLAGARLLLVEANPLSQSVLRAVLGPRVGAIDLAANGEEARAQLTAAPPSIVLADGATLGGDLAAAGALAAAAHEQGACFALLWVSPDEAQRAALAAAGLAVIAKPISAPDLVAAVDSLYISGAPVQPAARAA